MELTGYRPGCRKEGRIRTILVAQVHTLSPAFGNFGQKRQNALVRSRAGDRLFYSLATILKPANAYDAQLNTTSLAIEGGCP